MRWGSGAWTSKLAGAAPKPLGVPAARPARPSLGKHHCSPSARTAALPKFSCWGSLLTFHGSFPTGAGSLGLLGLIRSDFGKGLIANGKLSGANEPQPGGSQELLERCAQFRGLGSTSAGLISGGLRASCQLTWRGTQHLCPWGAASPVPSQGGVRVSPSPCPSSGRTPARATDGDGGPGAAPLTPSSCSRSPRL